MSARLSLAAALIFGVLDLAPVRAGSLPGDNAGCAAHASEAAARSGLPVDIILRVMRAESGGVPRALSIKGAMGCMQIMPATWSYLSARYRLGADPYDTRMNMIGGAMYLAELAARYRFPGAFAAYNAGPGRYERYAAGRAALPAETIAYAARLGSRSTATAVGASVPVRWQEASILMLRGDPTVTPGTESKPITPPMQASGSLFPLLAQDRAQSSANAGP